MHDDYTLSRQLCDDAGLVSDRRIPGSPNLFDPELTFLRQLNNLRAHTGLAPVATPFHCTGSAHLAGEHIRCDSPAHTARVIWTEYEVKPCSAPAVVLRPSVSATTSSTPTATSAATW